MKNDEQNEIKRRLEVLEKSVSDLNNNLVEKHLRTITLVFSCVTGLIALCALLVTFLGYISKSDVHDSTRDMESRMDKTSAELEAKVDKTTSEMERKFEALSGEALKKPSLQILFGDQLLDGQEFKISSNSQLPFYPLFFKNNGDKKSDPLSIRLYCSTDIGLNGGEYWQRIPSNDKDYPFCYYFMSESRTMGIGVAPKETWAIAGTYEDNVSFVMTNVFNCKLLAFYGADEPAEAKFVIRLK
jgi:tetrahydromethanopterin S-methyltransferase subunit G